MKTTILAAAAAAAALAITAAPAAAETPSLTPADSSPCKDPWINYAYRTAVRRPPIGVGEVGECSIRLYAAGRWTSYDQLKRSVLRFGSSRYAIRKSPAGGVYEMINKATGGQVNGVLKVLDQSGVTRLWNLMNQLVKTYSVQDVGTTEDLGDGTALLVK